MHGKIAVGASIQVLRDLINNDEGYCCAECKKKMSGKGDDSNQDGIEHTPLLMQDRSGSERGERDPEVGLP